jgi:hypothetical protein
VTEESEEAPRWPEGPDGQIDRPAAMSALAQTFPSLLRADGIAPWDPARFVRWLAGPAPGLAAVPFDLFESVSVWDSAHRRACAAWIETPFWFLS